MTTALRYDEFLARLDGIRARIEPLERLVAACAASLLPPIFYHSDQEHYGYRYGKPGVRHFCLLKAVRAVSALNAMIALARGGFAQEIGVLVRTLVECTTHIEFVLDALDQNDVLAPDVDKHVQDFFADFARNSSADFKRAQVRQGIVHKRLGATLDNIAQQTGHADQRAPDRLTIDTATPQMSISRITPGQISFIASMDSRIRLNLRKRNSSRSQGIGSAWPLEAGDLGERGLAHPRADTVEEGKLQGGANELAPRAGPEDLSLLLYTSALR
jgi:hypothetical protein